MKKSGKQTKQAGDSKKTPRSNAKKNTGYKEEVYDAEEQSEYKKSEFDNNDKKNTSGPK